MVGHFLPKTTSVTIFYDYLACSNQALNFLCVNTPNAIKVTKFRTIPMKLWFLKNSLMFFFFNSIKLKI